MAPRPLGDGQKRKSWSIKAKLDIVKEYVPGVKGKGFDIVGRRFGVDKFTLRQWVTQKDKLEEALKNTITNSRTQRRLGGGGRKPAHDELEEQLEQWVLQKNKSGLRVRDQYIQAKARVIYKLQKKKGEVEEGAVFDGLTGWMTRFKSRKGFVSRRHTTSRTLPSDAADTCRAFIDEIHSVINKHSISPVNVFNMNQVPRYFETESSSTIATRGTREVLMRKASSSHKRFTVTFTISMAGEMLKPHLLFAKLKNKPAVEESVVVDVNMTGMGSMDTIISFINDTIASRKETAFSRKPVLLIIDSYGPHLKVAESERLKKMNIHVCIVPPNLTGILQPLDVAVNRFFQQSYGRQYDAYISNASENPSLQIGFAKEFAEAPVPVNVDLLTAPKYFIPEDVIDGQQNSYWQCLHRVVLGRAPSITSAEFRSNTVEHMKVMEVLADITDDAYFADLASGANCDEEYIAYAIT
ncbi:hypothetical protein CBR_g19003 [Chara braunii]|uniref:HTH CENPB-type domain-containing protein n=1 Tax=Chara braunii TaxID=69332 RepID=A0A388KX22_CHABU|nr:hypothetical protein CBR_g19003 [Chara braunii]|eukprot:GBG74595.1 hypothetical protein CBR_g19003 [Chara braunii]